MPTGLLCIILCLDLWVFDYSHARLSATAFAILSKAVANIITHQPFLPISLDFSTVILVYDNIIDSSAFLSACL